MCERWQTIVRESLFVKLKFGLWFVAGIVDARRRSYWRRHQGAVAFRAGSVIRVWRRSSGHDGAVSSADFNGISGHVPLVVYYRVAVLFNKWYVSYRAVVIV